jgi:hypothetical protein
MWLYRAERWYNPVPLAGKVSAASRPKRNDEAPAVAGSELRQNGDRAKSADLVSAADFAASVVYSD